MTDRTRRIAYVLPVFNEADTIAAFHQALVAATDTRSDLGFEFLYVDDGSRDGSLERLVELREKDGRVIEYVDHLHEHFVDPCLIENAAYMPPTRPGFSIEMKEESIRRYTFAG